MVMWEIYYTKQASKGSKKLASAGLKNKAMELLSIIQENPYQIPPPYEKLVGDLNGAIRGEPIPNSQAITPVYHLDKY